MHSRLTHARGTDMLRAIFATGIALGLAAGPLIAQAPAPALPPSASDTLILAVLGLSFPALGGDVVWTPGVDSAMAGQHTDVLRATGPTGDAYTVIVTYKARVTCVTEATGLFVQGWRGRGPMRFVTGPDWLGVQAYKGRHERLGLSHAAGGRPHGWRDDDRHRARGLRPGRSVAVGPWRGGGVEMGRSERR